MTVLLSVCTHYIQCCKVASAHGEAVKNHWFLDRRFMITVVSVVFILPWLFPRRIGILSYTRCDGGGGGGGGEGGREGERGRERERERERVRVRESELPQCIVMGKPRKGLLTNSGGIYLSDICY